MKLVGDNIKEVLNDNIHEIRILLIISKYHKRSFHAKERVIKVAKSLYSNSEYSNSEIKISFYYIKVDFNEFNFFHYDNLIPGLVLFPVDKIDSPIIYKGDWTTKAIAERLEKYFGSSLKFDYSMLSDKEYPAVVQKSEIEEDDDYNLYEEEKSIKF